MKQTEFPGMEIVDIRLKVPRYKRDKLKLLSVIEKTSMNALLENCIDKLIAENDKIKLLEQAAKS